MTNPLIPVSNACFTVDEAAALLKVHTVNPRLTIMKLARKRVLKGYKIGKEWRFHPDSINNLLLGKA